MNLIVQASYPCSPTAPKQPTSSRSCSPLERSKHVLHQHHLLRVRRLGYAILFNQPAQILQRRSTAHTGALGSMFVTTHRTWQTEYSDLSGGWATSWYGSGGAGDGMTWASQILTALTTSNCSANLYWVATQGWNANENSISAGASSYTVSKRLWALAQYSRHTRPGARRVDASQGGMRVTALLNLDGSLIVPCMNTEVQQLLRRLSLGVNTSSVTAWVRSNTQDMASTPTSLDSYGTVSGGVGGRSLVTFVLAK
jgi:hypothetical protein